jgi:hypothetical protein
VRAIDPDRDTPREPSPTELVGPAGAPASCRALARVPPSSGNAEPAPDCRPAATFLAQLIATAHGLPQTRARRRAEPEDACAVYTAAMAIQIAASRELLELMGS